MRKHACCISIWKLSLMMILKNNLGDEAQMAFPCTVSRKYVHLYYRIHLFIKMNMYFCWGLFNTDNWKVVEYFRGKYDTSQHLQLICFHEAKVGISGENRKRESTLNFYCPHMLLLRQIKKGTTNIVPFLSTPSGSRTDI